MRYKPNKIYLNEKTTTGNKTLDSASEILVCKYVKQKLFSVAKRGNYEY